MTSKSLNAKEKTDLSRSPNDPGDMDDGREVRGEGIPGRQAPGNAGSRPREVRNSRSGSVDSRLVEYERRKAFWLAAHPNAKWDEIGTAFRVIAGDLGI